MSLFECSECGKSYSSQEALNRHSNNHTGVKRYTCGTCKISFNRHDVLSRHQKKVHVRVNGSSNSAIFDRRRCIKACDRCRKYKSKCDGDDPCTACKNSDAVCTYDQKSRRNCRRMDNSVSTTGVTPVPPTDSSTSTDPAAVSSHPNPRSDTSTPPQHVGELIGSLQIPDIGGLQDIWSETGDWSWILDGSPHELDFFPDSNTIASLLGATNTPIVSQAQSLRASPSSLNEEGVLDELIHHAMARYTRPNVERQSMEAATWYELSAKVESAFRLESWRQYSSEPHIFYWFMSLYFRHFHLLYAFFWQQGFDYPSIPPVLCLTLGMVGAMFHKDKECVRYGQALHSKLCSTLSGAMLLVPDGDEGTIPILVSMLVTQIMAIYSSESRKLHYAQQISGVLVSQSRRLKLFSDLEHTRGDLAKWIRVETRKRIAFGIFLNESYLSMIANTRPLVSAEELNITLPCSDEEWTYVGPAWQTKMVSLMERTEEVHQRLYFSDIYRILLDEDEILARIDPAHHRLLLLGLQSEVWRFCHDGQIFSRLCGSQSVDEVKKRREDVFYEYSGTVKWRHMNTLIKDHEKIIQTLQKWKKSFTADVNHVESTLTKQLNLSSRITYHTYHVALNAPLDVLHAMADDPHNNKRLEKNHETVKSWAKSSQSQRAIFHVNEIWSTIHSELQKPPAKRASFNIASLIGLHHSAALIWVCAGIFNEDTESFNSPEIYAGYPITPTNTSILMKTVQSLMKQISPKFGWMWSSLERLEVLSQHRFSPS